MFIIHFFDCFESARNGRWYIKVHFTKSDIHLKCEGIISAKIWQKKLLKKA